MEIVEVIMLIIIAIETALILYKKKDEPKEGKVGRREITGTFGNPLGDNYRRNTRGQLVPIKPNSKMLDGDEEDEI